MEAARMSLNGRIGVVRSTLERLGEATTLKDVNGELERIGQPPVQKPTYINNYFKVFGHEPADIIRVNGVHKVNGESLVEQLVVTEQPVAIKPVTKVSSVSMLNRVTALIHLAAVVDECGGVVQTRKYLDILEQAGEVK